MNEGSYNALRFGENRRKAFKFSFGASKFNANLSPLIFYNVFILMLPSIFDTTSFQLQQPA